MQRTADPHQTYFATDIPTTLSVDLLTSGLMHDEGLSWTVVLPTLMLIAQPLSFQSIRRHTHSQTQPESHLTQGQTNHFSKILTNHEFYVGCA